jgi:hypothetical protein
MTAALLVLMASFTAGVPRPHTDLNRNSQQDKELAVTQWSGHSSSAAPAMQLALLRPDTVSGDSGRTCPVVSALRALRQLAVSDAEREASPEAPATGRPPLPSLAPRGRRPIIDSPARSGVPVAFGTKWSGVVARDSAAEPVEYSDWYAKRLKLHRWGSYLMLPMFAVQWWAGEKLIDDDFDGGDDDDEAGWVKPVHQTTAWGLAGLFGVNTITGAWNLWDSRRDPEGRTKRYLHTLLMLSANAGFLYTATLTEDAEESSAGAHRHRNAALVSMGIATAGTAMMWFFK